MPRRIKRRKVISKLLEIPGSRASGSSKLTTEQLIERREKAWNLRLIDGMPFDKIGEALGTNKEIARKDCQWVYEMKAKGMIEKDAHVLAENSAIYEHILNTWMPLLKPLLDETLVVGETKRDRKGKEYDITVANYEAAKAATDAILKASLQRERLHGYQGRDGRPSEEALKGAGMAVFELMRAAASKPAEPKVIQATEVTDGQLDK